MCGGTTLGRLEARANAKAVTLICSVRFHTKWSIETYKGLPTGGKEPVRRLTVKSVYSYWSVES